MNFGNPKTLWSYTSPTLPHLMADCKGPKEGADTHSESTKQQGRKERAPLRNRGLGRGVGWGMRFLAQSFLRGNGTPVSTWQIPVR